MSSTTDITVADETAASRPLPHAPTHPFLSGNPAALGIPVFVVGSIALGLDLIGYVGSTPFANPGAPLSVITAGAGLGLSVATIWAITLGQTAVATIFGVFAGFWLSYGLLVFGLVHNWFGVAPADIAHTEATFLIAWLTIIATLTLGTLRLPLAFSAILIAVDLALIAVLIGVLQASTGWFTLSGVLAFIFAGLGAWVYLGVCLSSTGGTDVPLGRPIVAS